MREEKVGRLREMNRFVAASCEVAEDERRLGRFYFFPAVVARKDLSVLRRLLEFIKKSLFWVTLDSSAFSPHPQLIRRKKTPCG